MLNSITLIAAFNPIDWILKLFGKVLAFFDSVTGFYILSIFVFAVLAKILLFPFGIKQQKNSIKQAKLRPKEQAIRSRYKGRTDKVTQNKMQQEIMDLYSSEGYSPFGGCLPMLIQFPIIIGLYEIIRNPLKYTVGLSDEIITKIRDTINFLGSSGLKGVDSVFNSSGVFTGANGLDYMTVLKNEENFNAVASRIDMGIKYSDLPNFNFLGLDLSVTPNQVFGNWNLWYFLIIPALTFLTVWISMKLTKKMTYQPMQQDAAGCSGKIMDLSMPLLSTWFSFMFPAMLGVYWMFNNLLGILQSFILKKMYPLPVFTEEDYKAAERELKGKAPRSASEDNRVVPGKKYVSLHHIDDEDYDEKGNYIGPPQPTREQEEAENAAKVPSDPSPDAPVLKEDDPHRDIGKKNKKK